MPNYAMIDAQGAVVNRIVLEAAEGYSAPDGLTLLQETDTPYDIGGTVLAGVYTPPKAPALPPAPTVTSVTPRQARLALLAAGLLDKVESAVAAAGGATKITWDYATAVNRDDPMIASIGSALSLTSAQIDALFTQAAIL
jgi:hypothetical protein